MSGVNLLPWREARDARQRRRFMAGLVVAVSVPLLVQLVLAWALVHEQRTLRHTLAASEATPEPPAPSVEVHNDDAWVATRTGLEALLAPPVEGLAVGAWAMWAQGPGLVELRIRGEAMDGAAVSRLLARVQERDGMWLRDWGEGAAGAGEPRPFSLRVTWSQEGRP